MAHTIVKSYSDLHPTVKADNSLVVVFNKDGTLNLDRETLQTLISQPTDSTLLSFVRINDDGKLEEHSDHSSDDGTAPHINLTVDAFFDSSEIFNEDAVIELLSPLHINTKEHCLEAFRNDHCYTPLVSPSQTHQSFESSSVNVDLESDILCHSIAKPQIPTSKKITILEQRIIPKGKTLINVSASDAQVILKGAEALRSSLSGFVHKVPKPVKQVILSKTILDKQIKIELKRHEVENNAIKTDKDESSESSSESATYDHDSDSDYKDSSDRMLIVKSKPKQHAKCKSAKKIVNKNIQNLQETAIASASLKPRKVLHGKNLNRKNTQKPIVFNVKKIPQRKYQRTFNKKTFKLTPDISTEPDVEKLKNVPKAEVCEEVKAQDLKPETKPETQKVQKVLKKDKKRAAHVTALLSDMTSLFSTPDVIRRVSTDSKSHKNIEKPNTNAVKILQTDVTEKVMGNPSADDKFVIKTNPKIKTYSTSDVKLSRSQMKAGTKKIETPDKVIKVPMEEITPPDETALVQLLTDTNVSSLSAAVDHSKVPTNTAKEVLIIPNALNATGLSGPLSPSLDLLASLQPEEEGLTEDLLMHVAHLVENNENLQEVIDKQVLGKVSDSVSTKVSSSIPSESVPVILNKTLTEPHMNRTSAASSYHIPKLVTVADLQKTSIQVVRSDGRVITLPPIEAPATRSSKRKSLNVPHADADIPLPDAPNDPATPNVQVSVSQNTPKQYINKKLTSKKSPSLSPERDIRTHDGDEITESVGSWNSEDDPNRLWCICNKPHNNRFMICCDTCEDWFHGKCVNITKAMGHQMEERGIEWNCPTCLKKKADSAKASAKVPSSQRVILSVKDPSSKAKLQSVNTTCIVCKKAARASSIYCSDVCILKHAQESSSGSQPTTPVVTSPKESPKQTNTGSIYDTRVIVYERESGRCLAGSSAPTAANLKTWLQQHPTFEVVRPSGLNAGRKSVALPKSPAQKTKVQPTSKAGPQRSGTQKPGLQKQIILTSPPSKQPGIAVRPQNIKVTNQETTPVKKDVPPQTTPKSQNITKLQVTPKSPKVIQNKQPSKLLVRTPSQQSPSLKSPPPNKRKEEYKLKSETPDSSKDVTALQRSTVRKSLLDQMTLRMADENESKMTSDHIKKFVNDTESEMYEVFKDTAKYKAKYRSLIFNIGDKKNKSLWQKICDRTVTPKQLVRLSPEELASQELAQWRDKEAKYQLELIKKSEIDLLTCAKTYVLKTHKGEEVMESSASTTTGVDPNVSVEDLVTALNDPSGTLTLSKTTPPTDQSGNLDHNKHSKNKSHHKKSKEHSSSHKDNRHKSKNEKLHKKSHKHKSKGSSKKDDTIRHNSIRKSSRKDKRKDKSEDKHHIRSKSKEERAEVFVKEELKKVSPIDETMNKSSSLEEHKRRSRSRGRSRHRSYRSPSRRRSHSRGRSSIRSKSKEKVEIYDKEGNKKVTSIDDTLNSSISLDELNRRSRSRGHSRHRSHLSPSRGRSRFRSHSRGRSKHRTRSKTHSKHRGRSKLRSHSKVDQKHRSISKDIDSSDLSSSSKEGRKKRSPKNGHERSVSQDSSDKSKSYMADVHPEYDPHVAMVTSALSEEDLRRSKDDSFDDSSDMLDSSLAYALPHEEYDPAKSGNYNIVSSTPILADTSISRPLHRLSSGTESDQEPSSTVDSIPVSVWNGCINMVDVARFLVTAQEVSGNCSDLSQDLTSELDIVGRINPDTVWDYIVKMKKAGNKDLLVLRLTAANDEERMQYIALYSYLSSRNRLGVIKVTNTMSVKDFYIVPLSSHAPIPTVLLPFNGPGFEDFRPHLLIGVLLRQRKKRPHEIILPPVPTKVPKIDVKSVISNSILGKDGSYTPPTSPRVTNISSSLSKLPILPPLPALSSTVKDKIAASLAAADNDNEPYSPGGSDSSKGSETHLSAVVQTPPIAVHEDLLSRKMEELEREIAEERKKIISISKSIKPSPELDEPYSPSRPMTPAPVSNSGASLGTLADISLPSNLQEILANIQKNTQPPSVEEYVPSVIPPPPVADVDMRVLSVQPPLPLADFSKPPPSYFPPAIENPKGTSKLSMLSDEELLSMVPDEAIAPSAPKSVFIPQPPPPPRITPDLEGTKYQPTYRNLSQPPPPGQENDI